MTDDDDDDDDDDDGDGNCNNMFLTQSSNSCKYYLPWEFPNVVGVSH